MRGRGTQLVRSGKFALTDDADRANIQTVFDSALQSLAAEDHQIPQVRTPVIVRSHCGFLDGLCALVAGRRPEVCGAAQRRARRAGANDAAARARRRRGAPLGAAAGAACTN